MLLKSPGFTTVAVLTLALGIGANTAIFSLIDAVLLKMLPVRNPQELVLLEVANGQEIEKTFSSPLYRTLRDHNQVFSGMFASSGFLLDLTTDDQTGSKLTGELVSGSYFSVLGVSPILGRVLTTEDERAVGMYPVAVISYGLWQERFALNPSVVGQTITLNRTPFTVVGVTPSEFFGESVDRLSQVWLPMTMQPQISGGNSSLEDIGVEWLTVMGRLKSRVGLEQARANLNVLFRQYQAEVVGNIKNAQAKQELLNQRIELVSGSKGFSELRERFSQPFLILMTVVGLVLLVACANVANLLLARAAARQKEISVRLAVGAGRIRLIRQLLTESLLLALTGGAFGLLLARWGSHAVSNLLLSNPTPIPRSLDPSWRILGFTSAVSLLTGILFGLVPALRTTQIDLNMALKDSSRGLSNMRSRLGWRGVLVISQVAVSLLLLIGAGLFVRSLQKLRSLDAGFERHNVLTLMIDPERGGYTAKQLGNLYQELLERLKSLPGVRAAGLSQNSLFTGNDIGLCCASVPGYLPRPGENRYVRFDIVSPGFFSNADTVGPRLRRTGQRRCLQDSGG